MKRLATWGSLAFVAAIAACSKEQTPDAQTPAYGNTQGYGQTQTNGQYQGTGQNQGYGQTQGSGQTTTVPTATATATNPLALACQTDATCLTAKCNLQTGHCMFPCSSSADCQTGNGCVAGACIPGAP